MRLTTSSQNKVDSYLNKYVSLASVGKMLNIDFLLEHGPNGLIADDSIPRAEIFGVTVAFNIES